MEIKEHAKILVVAQPHRRTALLKTLEGRNLQIYLASSFQEARDKLDSSAASYDVLIADVELPDGSWQDLLSCLLDIKRPCEMIVCSRCGDERLWAEVLQCGAYDLLVEPFEKQEVHRIIENALDSQYMRRFCQMATSAKAS